MIDNLQGKGKRKIKKGAFIFLIFLISYFWENKIKCSLFQIRKGFINIESDSVKGKL